MFKACLQGLASLLTPLQCELCHRAVQKVPSLCWHCQGGLRTLPTDHCYRCALPLESSARKSLACESCLREPPSFAAVWAPWLYTGPTREVIKLAKYQSRPRLMKSLVQWAPQEDIETLLDWDPDGMVPVPISRRKLIRRGYNQSVLLAEYWKKHLRQDWRIYPIQVKRVHRPPQASLERQERMRTWSGFFKIKTKHSFDQKRLLIIDDVMTTGATVEALARCLLNQGAKAVAVLVLARVERLT